jgi:hypothetical protein
VAHDARLRPRLPTDRNFVVLNFMLSAFLHSSLVIFLSHILGLHRIVSVPLSRLQNRIKFFFLLIDIPITLKFIILTNIKDLTYVVVSSSNLVLLSR